MVNIFLFYKALKYALKPRTIKFHPKHQHKRVQKYNEISSVYTSFNAWTTNTQRGNKPKKCFGGMWQTNMIWPKLKSLGVFIGPVIQAISL